MLTAELKSIYQQIEKGEFKIEEGVEDIHSQVEILLTKKLGDVGKKIHSLKVAQRSSAGGLEAFHAS